MTGRKSRKYKEPEKVVNMTIFCQNLGKEVFVQSFTFWGQSNECELCGQHGNVTVNVSDCSCGKFHTIELADW